jgi:patatin-like phospholipase domain-containing protein 2
MLNLSLSGCGFLGIYHIGVISAFREHAPEFLEKISGCSAGALVAACAACDCCLGAMVSDVLEAALKARNHALGPLHPSFGLVDIIRNGLRRILPVDAHKICSGRVHISITRWRDGKNFIVNQFDTREELIQACVCSSFVPCYSGFIPPKFRGTYYWDGGLSNNNPILNEDTILVTPFGGESDICPKGESAAYFCYDFKGTNIQWSHENWFRASISLFPPDPNILKAICFRGYKDTIDFLKSRNLLECSCDRLAREKTSLSSVMGEDFHNYSLFEEKMDCESVVYDSEEDNLIQFADSNEPLNYREMPISVINVLDVACEENEGLVRYLIDSQLSRALSIMFLPWTLPFELSYKFTKKVLQLVPKIKVTPNSTSILDTLLIYFNYLIQRFTYDKYQYHARVTCNLCPRSRSNSQSKGSGIQFSVCYHSNGSINKNNNNEQIEKSNSIYEKQTKCSDTSSHTSKMSGLLYPKLCARHRVPSICSSEASHYRDLRKSRRTRSSNGSDLASSVDINEFKSKSSRYYARQNSGGSDQLQQHQQQNNRKPHLRPSKKDRSSQNDDNKLKLFMVNEQADNIVLPSANSTVHFHLNINTPLTSTDEEGETESNPLNSTIKIKRTNGNFSIEELNETAALLKVEDDSLSTLHYTENNNNNNSLSLDTTTTTKKKKRFSLGQRPLLG